jgi:hypothetical protein
MLADVSLLLHEINDAVRLRRGSRVIRAVEEHAATSPVSVFVSGLASGGKERLIGALRERLAANRITVRAGAPPEDRGPSLHVHAETDVEALIEGRIRIASRPDGRRPDVIVPVDWESTERSVRRVVEALIDRGLADVEAGA